MRYLITSQQCSFYTKHDYIAFDGLISPEEADLICQQRKRYKRDLWRTSPDMKKLLLNPCFAEIAAQLLNKKPLRIAYDQAGDFPPGRYTLQEMNALQNLACALIIKVTDTPASGSSILPKAKGDGVFFSPGLLFDWSAVQASDDYVLIVYGHNKMIYVLQSKDPYVHALKREGYVFGDLVQDRTHPILFR